jgi:hypothetical protein
LHAGGEGDLAADAILQGGDLKGGSSPFPWTRG